MAKKTKKSQEPTVAEETVMVGEELQDIVDKYNTGKPEGDFFTRFNLYVLNLDGSRLLIGNGCVFNMFKCVLYVHETHVVQVYDDVQYLFKLFDGKYGYELSFVDKPLFMANFTSKIS